MVTFWWSHVCGEPSLISTKRRLFAVGLLVTGASWSRRRFFCWDDQFRTIRPLGLRSTSRVPQAKLQGA
jgi:hypothetical protein